MRRDGIDGYFEVWAVSEELGVEKPDPMIYARAIERSGTVAAASSGNGRDGTVNGAPGWTRGQGLAFDGSTGKEVIVEGLNITRLRDAGVIP